MTDPTVADAVYLEPLTVDAIEAVIAREKPEGLLAGLGGQTALNLATALAEAGVLDRHDVRLLGTPLEAIRMAEDREAFRDLLDRIDQPYAPSYIVEGPDDAARRASAEAALADIGLPAIIRPAFTLGGTGGGIVGTADAYWERVRAGLRASPIKQVMIERCLVGWQEIEYEVMRDAEDTCIAVCSMENVDPLGVHTGDSIVVAPVQTLTDAVHQRLRSAALAIIRALGVEGGCNVQFALSPDSTEYAVIEVNPRVSRSSALASKATGYPIARVAAQIAAGRTLAEIPNVVTGTTVAAFEPALDYVVVKLPRFPFDKFPGADRHLGSQMKATGEVMAIDRTFGAALNKALRGLEQAGAGPLGEDPSWQPTFDYLAAVYAGAGSTSAATPARALASPSDPPRRSCCASSSSRPTRGCGGSSGCSAGAWRRRRSARRRASHPGSSPRWAATSAWRRTSERPARASSTRRTRTAPASSRPSSAPASPTGTWRRSRAWRRARSGPLAAPSASSPATRWSTPVPPSSPPRRRTSTRPTHRPDRRPRRRPSTGQPPSSSAAAPSGSGRGSSSTTARSRRRTSSAAKAGAP
jgi:carbamoylphosphate synthase large subunit